MFKSNGIARGVVVGLAVLMCGSAAYAESERTRLRRDRDTGERRIEAVESTRLASQARVEATNARRITAEPLVFSDPPTATVRRELGVRRDTAERATASASAARFVPIQQIDPAQRDAQAQASGVRVVRSPLVSRGGAADDSARQAVHTRDVEYAADARRDVRDARHSVIESRHTSTRHTRPVRHYSDPYRYRTGGSRSHVGFTYHSAPVYRHHSSYYSYQPYGGYTYYHEPVVVYPYPVIYRSPVYYHAPIYHCPPPVYHYPRYRSGVSFHFSTRF